MEKEQESAGTRDDRGRWGPNLACRQFFGGLSWIDIHIVKAAYKAVGGLVLIQLEIRRLDQGKMSRKG